MSGRSTPLLHEHYTAERASIGALRAQAFERLRAQRTQDQERLRRIAQRRQAAIRLVAKGRVAWFLWNAYERRAERRDRERLRSRHRAAVRAVWSEYGSTGWLDWLRDAARKGDREAVAALQERSARHRTHSAATHRPSDSRPDLGGRDAATAPGVRRDPCRRRESSDRRRDETACEGCSRNTRTRPSCRIRGAPACGSDRLFRLISTRRSERAV